MSDRVERVRAILAARSLPAILISSAENRRYLSGFTGSAGHLLITPTEAVLLTDFRYVEQAAEEAPHFVVRKLENGLLKELPALKSDFGLTQLGFEAGALTYLQWEQLQAAAAEAGIELVPTKEIVEPVRMIKDREELNAIERAVAIADAAVEAVAAWLRPGVTELEVAWELEKRMREAGAEGLAFSVIVGSGARGALPHAQPTRKRIEAGEPIVLDLGCIVDGYRSDLTRTFCLGEPDPYYLEIYDIVLRAQQAAEAGIRPGMKGGEADKIARDLIAEAGYGDQFGHSLGHGIGLQTHEGPLVRRESEDVLQPGMVFSVEPGIYLPGKFGVRIEDLVVLEEEGVRVLSKAPKEPAIRRRG
ncbi:MAG: aminopeptidase P family protein [Chloroflexota bacterium]|nr:aminopeptidase P family protein [Dehalococcoidia bacterium]MDW8253660.1 aminopeptidase P family protein [Chloroflexota bacterium]